MLIDKIFPEFKMPKDRNVTKRMIEEYDKKVSLMFYKTLNGTFQRKHYTGSIRIPTIVGMPILLLMAVLLISANTNMFAVIKLLYIIVPLAIYVYYVIIFMETRNMQDIDKKSIFKKNIALECTDTAFILEFIFMLQSCMLRKSELHLLITVVFIVWLLISLYVSRIDSPKRFQKEFINNNNKYKDNKKLRSNKMFRSVSSKINLIIFVISIIFSITQPILLMFVIGYILVVIAFQDILYDIYMYNQYDSIKKLEALMIGIKG